MEFRTKNIGITDGSVAVQKSKENYQQKLSANDYLFGKDAPNQDAIRKIFQDIFNEVLPKQLF
jgi:hypothetical protein